MTAVLDIEAPTHLPDRLLPAIRKVIRCADAYRSACTVLEAYEADFRQFRTLQCLTRISNSESVANRRREALDAAIDEMRSLTTTNGD